MREKIIKLLTPYVLDRGNCGYEDGNCLYLTSGGKCCIAGSAMENPSKFSNGKTITDILIDYNQNTVFKEEYIDVFTKDQWGSLQIVHDDIAVHGYVKFPTKQIFLNEFGINYNNIEKEINELHS